MYLGSRSWGIGVLSGGVGGLRRLRRGGAVGRFGERIFRQQDEGEVGLVASSQTTPAQGVVPLAA